MNIIPFPLLMVVLGFLIGSAVSASNKKSKSIWFWSIFIIIILVFTTKENFILALPTLCFYLVGVVIKQKPVLVNVALTVLLAEIMLFTFSQVFIKSKISFRTLSLIFQPDLVYYYFWEIVSTSIIFALIIMVGFKVLSFYIKKIRPTKAKEFTLIFIFTIAYLIEPFFHFSHLQYGYSTNFISAPEIFWFFFKTLIIYSSIRLGMQLTKIKGVYGNRLETVNRRRVILITLLLMLLHVVSLAFLTHDGNIMIIIMVPLIVSISLLMGMVLCRSLESVGLL